MKFRPTLVLGLLLAGLTSALTAQPAPLAAADTRLDIPATDDMMPGAGPVRRFDWFQKKWHERRNAWAKAVAQDQHAVVFLGDSITEGWERTMAATFPGMKLANRGISGDTTRGVLYRLPEDVFAVNPRGIVLLIGTNDLEEQATPETITSNLKLILAACKAHNPKMPIILCQVFPSSLTKKRPAGEIKRINHLYQRAVKGDPQVTYLETWAPFANAEGDAKADELPDLLHPNAAGYAKWAAALRPVLESLELLPVPADTFTPEPGFVSLFNGRDLTGWGYRPSSDEDRESARRWQASDPEGAAAWPFVTEAVTFDGLRRTPDNRFAAINGRLVVTTPPEFRKVQKLWTTAEFGGNFILKLEFRATPLADSGIYLRGPQLQCRDYLLAGPYTKLQHYKPQDWNEIIVTVRDGVAHCTCNGEVLEAEFKIPASGPIGVEGDRGQMEYRRIRLQQLP